MNVNKLCIYLFLVLDHTYLEAEEDVQNGNGSGG